ncbi:MAG: DNA polymerase domain-containing protein [Candidatus Heimdallarchaeaceae archaeon]
MNSNLAEFLSENSKKEKEETNLQNQTNEVNKKNTTDKEKGSHRFTVKHNKQTLDEKGKDYILIAPDNLPPSILIDVKYDGKKEQAYVKLFNPEDGRVYRWYDKTNHLPYLLTTLSKTKVEDKLKNEKEFIGCEIVKKHNLLNDKTINLTKVLASNPLAIGGKNNSYRNQLSPSFESNIRYHLSYIYDRQLVPCTYYTIQNGDLMREEPKISVEVQEGIFEIFKGQSPEIARLVEQNMPMFFAPIPSIKRCSVDIEVHSEPNKIPDPNTATEKVISIGISDTDGNTWVYVLNEEGKSIDKTRAISKFIEFKDEAELLKAVFRKMCEYPVVITFNGDNFDFLYLDSRARKLKIEETIVPFVRTRTQDIYLANAVHIDLYRFFRQPAMRIYAFGGAYDRVTLDELGKALLSKEKVKLDKYIWDLDLEDLIKYNAQDAEITLELTTFSSNQAIELIFMLSRITKMPIDDFTRSSVSIWVQNWMYYEHRFRDYLIPRKEDIMQLKGDTSTEAIIKGKKYQGAIVIEPQVGVWWNVYVLDFASLYPSIIKTRNLSYETINCTHAECKGNKIPETSHWVCSKNVGITSMLVGFVRDIRVYWFKDRAKDPNLMERERRQNDVIQSSLKVLLNACLPYDEEIIIRDRNKNVSKIKIGELKKHNWREFEVLSINRKEENFGKPKFVQILNFMENGKQKTIEIRFKDGRNLRCTNKHIIPRLKGEKIEEVAAEDLQINDDILLCKNVQLPNFNEDVLFISDNIKRDSWLGLKRENYRKYSFKRNQKSENPVLSVINQKFLYSKQSKMYKCLWSNLSKSDKEIIRTHAMEFNFLIKSHKLTGKWYPAQITLADDFIKLLGYYISEGTIAKNRFHITQYVANNKEKYSKIEGVLERLSKNRYFQLYKTNKGFTGNGNILTQLLENLCGKGSKNKKIPLQILNAERSKTLLDAYFLGDGNYNSRGNKRYSTVSNQLKNDLVYLLNGLGIDTSIHKGREPIFRIVETAGKNYKRKKKGEIDFQGTSIVKIITIEDSSIEEVYDITTGNGWFVTTNGLVVHNCYGVFGSDNFALYCPPVAESTAALAREAITKTKQYCEQKLDLQVLYGDTDSIFVLQPTEENIRELEDWSMRTFQIELGTDYVFRYCGLSDRKKNYFGITTKGKPIVKGLMGKKKNTPVLAKRPFEKALEVLSEVQNPDELEVAKKQIIKIIQKVIREISKKEFSLEDLAISVTLSKKLEQYDSWTQPLQTAVQLIIAFPEGERPSVGSVVSFIKTKPFKIQANDVRLSDKISKGGECSVKPLQLSKITDVDIPKIKELLKSTLVQLLDTIGISWDESIEGQKSLDNWFK